MSKGKKLRVFITGIVLFYLSGISLTLAQETGYEALLGTWDVETEDGQFTFVFNFSMEGDALNGVFEGPTGSVEMENLSFEDNELMFTVTVDAGGQVMVVDFSATIEEDSLEGFLSMEFGEINIYGKKRNSTT